MADEPVETSLHYDPRLTYTPPVGRLPVLGKIRAEIDQLRATLAVTVGQVDNELAKTINDTTRATNDTNKINAEMDALVLKTAAEVALLNQKTQTELAQVVDSIATGTVTGVIGKQKLLFAKQTDGFDRDAEQKLAKMYMDMHAVRMTTSGDDDAANAGVTPVDISAVLDVARAGINVPPNA